MDKFTITEITKIDKIRGFWFNFCLGFSNKKNNLFFQFKRNLIKSEKITLANKFRSSN